MSDMAFYRPLFVDVRRTVVLGILVVSSDLPYFDMKREMAVVLVKRGDQGN